MVSKPLLKHVWSVQVFMYTSESGLLNTVIISGTRSLSIFRCQWGDLCWSVSSDTVKIRTTLVKQTFINSRLKSEIKGFVIFQNTLVLINTSVKTQILIYDLFLLLQWDFNRQDNVEYRGQSFLCMKTLQLGPVLTGSIYVPQIFFLSCVRWNCMFYCTIEYFKPSKLKLFIVRQTLKQNVLL